MYRLWVAGERGRRADPRGERHAADHAGAVVDETTRLGWARSLLGRQSHGTWWGAPGRGHPTLPSDGARHHSVVRARL